MAFITAQEALSATPQQITNYDALVPYLTDVQNDTTRKIIEDYFLHKKTLETIAQEVAESESKLLTPEAMGQRILTAFKLLTETYGFEIKIKRRKSEEIEKIVKKSITTIIQETVKAIYAIIAAPSESTNLLLQKAERITEIDTEACDTLKAFQKTAEYSQHLEEIEKILVDCILQVRQTQAQDEAESKIGSDINANANALRIAHYHVVQNSHNVNSAQRHGKLHDNSGRSEFDLKRKFKKTFKRTVKEYEILTRLQRILELLELGISIEVISEKMGFGRKERLLHYIRSRFRECRRIGKDHRGEIELLTAIRAKKFAREED